MCKKGLVLFLFPHRTYVLDICRNCLTEPILTNILAGLGGSVGCGFNPRRGWQHSFVEIDHEIFSTVIPSLLLIQEGQLSVSGERMCTILVNRLED